MVVAVPPTQKLPLGIHSISGRRSRLGTASSELAEPKHAWWRGLLAWPGSRVLGGRTGLQSTSSSFDPVEYSTSSQEYSSSSQCCYLDGNPSPSFLSFSKTSSSMQAPSIHLKWAKQVHASNASCIRAQRALVTLPARPPPKSGGKAKKDAHKRRMERPPIPPTRCWEDALRDKHGVDPLPFDYQEKKLRKKKMEWNLQRLKTMQSKWRHNHDELVHRKNLKSAEEMQNAPTLDLCEIHEVAEDEDDSQEFEDFGELSPCSTMRSSAKTCTPMGGSKQPSIAHMEVNDDGSLAPQSPQISPYGSGRLSGGLATLDGDASLRSLTPSEAGDQPKLKRGPTFTTRPRIASVESEVSSMSSADRRKSEHWQQGIRSRQSMGSPKTDHWQQGSRPGSRQGKSSGRISRGNEVDHSSPNWGDIWNGDNARYTASTPGSNTSSKRSSKNGPVSGPPILEDRESSGLQSTLTPKALSRANTRATIVMKESMDSWAEWRRDFPLEVLNGIADFYEESEPNQDGFRVVGAQDLQYVAVMLLGIPVASLIAQVQVSECLPPGSVDTQKGEVSFSSLLHLLSFARDTIDRVEDDDSSLLWSLEDLFSIEVVFTQRANTHGYMPIDQLFNAIGDLKFSRFDVNSAEEQQWLSGITKTCCKSSPRNRHPDAKGCISYKDLLRIISSALKSKERSHRAEMFEKEKAAMQEAGLLPVELEDLRELYGSYLALKVERSTSTLVQLLTLFATCGVPEFSNQEVARLKQIIQPHVIEHKHGQAQFHVFLNWMKQVFNLKLGGLESLSLMESSDQCDNFQDIGSQPPPMEKRGFTAVMLREEYRQSLGSDELHQTMCVSSPEGPSSRTSSHQQPSSRRASKGIGARRASDAMQHSLNQSPRGSLVEPKRISLTRNVRGVGRLAHELMDRRNSKIDNRGPSVSVDSIPGSPVGSPKLNSRPGSRPGSRSKAAKNDDGDGGIFQLKGLPSQEQILARKQFRPMSVDLSASARIIEGISASGDGENLEASINQVETLPGVKENPLDLRGSAPSSMLSTIAAAPVAVKLPLTSRSVKQAQDTSLVVSAAMEKLEALRPSFNEALSP